MILVTVGTEKFQFNRLMKWISLLVKQNWLTEKVVVQYGSCTFIPSGVEAYKLLPAPEFNKLAGSASLVIGHCGEGTLSLAEKIKAPYILVPRNCSFQEHVDNHQLELAYELDKVSVPIAFSREDLLTFVQNPYRTDFSTFSSLAIEEICQSLEKFSLQVDNYSPTSNQIINWNSLTNKLKIDQRFTLAQSKLKKIISYQRS